MTDQGHATAPASAGADFNRNASVAPDTFTPEQSRQMLEWAVADGLTTRDEADKVLASATAPAAAAGDVPAEVAELDAAFPAGKADDFTLPKLGDGTMGEAEITQVAGQLRGWMADARLPVGIGNFIAEEADRVGTTWATMDETSRDLWAAHQEFIGREFWGDKYDGRLELVRQIISEVEEKRPGLRQFLADTGLANSAQFVIQLGEHAARLVTRADAMEKHRKSR